MLRRCEDLRPDNDQCVLSPYRKVKEAGYTQIRVNRIKYYCHVVSAAINTNKLPEEGLQASHLCHTPACINPKHLTFEVERINKTRWCCKDYLGHHQNYTCPHTPPCMVYKENK